MSAAGVTTVGSWEPDHLIAGEEPRSTRGETLLSGENRTRGAVLGKITASGKLKLSAAAASDGSEVPYGILVEDCDASAADAPCLVYVAGAFNPAALTLGAGHTADSIKDGLRDLGIFLKKTVA